VEVDVAGIFGELGGCDRRTLERGVGDMVESY
jgi:hypothetical protein